MPDGQNFTAQGDKRTELMLPRFPGVGRDGTRLSQQSYIEALWCRFWLGLPRKMLGYTERVRNTNGIVRSIDVFSNDATTHVHIGSGNAIQHFDINNITSSNSALSNRTPAGFLPDPKYGWQFAQVFNTADGTTDLAAALLPSAAYLTSSTEYPVYHGDILG